MEAIDDVHRPNCKMQMLIGGNTTEYYSFKNVHIILIIVTHVRGNLAHFKKFWTKHNGMDPYSLIIDCWKLIIYFVCHFPVLSVQKSNFLTSKLSDFSTLQYKTYEWLTHGKVKITNFHIWIIFKNMDGFWV